MGRETEGGRDNERGGDGREMTEIYMRERERGRERDRETERERDREIEERDDREI